MSYSIQLADRIREYLSSFTELEIEEKEMFSGVVFMVNGKMCVNVSHENLMCRFDPSLQDELAERQGYQAMIMRGKEAKGYCYVTPEGFRSRKDFEFWVNLCLQYNPKAKASKKK